MTARTRWPWCVVAVALPLAAACGSDDEAASSGADVEGVVWSLGELDGEPVPDDVEVTLQYDGDNIAGTGGCNQYNGAAKFDEGAVDISAALAATMMMCPEPASTIEQRYFAALPTADGFRVEDDTLSLTAGDETVLVFTAG